MSRARSLVCRLAAASWLATVPFAARGQVAEPTPTTPMAAEPALTPESVEQERVRVETTMPETNPNRNQVDDHYRAAIAELQRAAAFAEQVKVNADETPKVSERVSNLKQELEQLGAAPKAVGESDDLNALEQELAELELKLNENKQRHASLDGELNNRPQRRKDVRQRIADISAALSGDGSEAAPPPSPDAPFLAAAQKTESRARTHALQQELAALQSELTKYDAEDAADLPRLRTDLAARRVSQLEKSVQTLKEKIKARREAEARASVVKARQEAIVAVPVLKSYAERNHFLAETAQKIAGELSEAEQKLRASEEAFDELDKQFQQTHKKVETVGLTSSVGALLRKQRATLPDATARRSAIAARRALIDETQYQMFEYGDERQELGDLDAVVQQVLADVGSSGASDEAFLESAARELLERKREYLDSLNKTYNDYFDTLVELDTKDRQVVQLTSDYSEYINERVLWIRSGKLLSRDFGLDESDTRLADSATWISIGSSLRKDFFRYPAGYVLAISLLGFCIVRGSTLRRKIGGIGETAEKANCRSIFPTLHALSLTVLISLLWPCACALLAWRMSRFEDAVAGAISQGLYCIALLWAPLEVMRQACRKRGLGESHFGWPSVVCSTIRRRLRWLAFDGLPCAFITASLLALDSTHGGDAIERISFIIGMTLVAVFLARTLSPNGLLREYIAYNQGGWVDRLKPLWPWLAASVPMALSILTFAGYYYTSQVLAWRLFATSCFLGSIYLIRAMLLRTLQLRRRSLAMEQAKERAAAAAAAAAAAGESSSNPVAGIVTAAPQSDLSTHSEQTRRLVTTGLYAAAAVGLWLIWVPVLPALTMLDRYPLWSNSVVAVVADAPQSPLAAAAAAEGDVGESSVASATQTPEATVTTLSDLALALLIAFITFVLARNGPGLLEMSVLQQLPFDASVRYAITTLVSYAIVLIGVIASCSTIGLQWSQVQWLATALTFGLAFGLQEMFANFVAGLIILLERPIRVGDIVTVDDVTGVVSRIRIRATSITNWDRKEYVVPNKEFITGRLLNWTLSDKVNRIVINVGIAYGSDTERAKDLLLEAANNHPLILKDPPSVATFEGFGDNSLNLVLRTYLPTLDNRLEVIHQLHTTINKAFRAEGIEIAFPQRDLHIRTTPAALALALEGDAADSDEEESKDAA